MPKLQGIEIVHENMSAMALRKTQEGFTGDDFGYLADNEMNRYASNSRRIAHAVLVREPDGDTVASQYHLPRGTHSEAPDVCQLLYIEEIQRGGQIRHRGKGPDGKFFYAKRYEHAQIKFDNNGAVSADIAYFSEDDEPDPKPHRELPRFRNEVADEIITVTKGGHDMVVEPESVRRRDFEHERRKMVMGMSARDAYEQYFKTMESKLSPELIEILKRAFNADADNQFRPEWLHAYAYGLMPIDKNPQNKDNIGAAGRWANTEMMILERIAKWFAVNQSTHTRITMKTLFDMLHESELINKIHFEVTIECRNRFIKFIQELDAFKQYPVLRKASDLAQATGISHAILHGHQSILRERITCLSAPSRKRSAPSHFSGEHTLFSRKRQQKNECFEESSLKRIVFPTYDNGAK